MFCGHPAYNRSTADVRLFETPNAWFATGLRLPLAFLAVIWTIRNGGIVL
jgi:hypothetical protein